MPPRVDQQKAWIEINGRADRAYKREDYAEAEHLYAELLAQLPADHKQHPLFTSHHAECLFRLGRFQECTVADYRVMNLALQNPKIDHVDVFMEEVLARRYETGNSLSNGGNYKAAANAYSLALKVSKAVYGEEHQISRDLGDALVIARENLQGHEEEEKKKQIRKKQEADALVEKWQSLGANGPAISGASGPISSSSQAADPSSRRGGHNEERKKVWSPAQGQDRPAQEAQSPSAASPPGRNSSKRPSAPVIHQPDIPKSSSQIPTLPKGDIRKTETSPPVSKNDLLSPNVTDVPGKRRSHSVGERTKEPATSHEGDKAVNGSEIKRTNSVDGRNKKPNPNKANGSMGGHDRSRIFDRELLSESNHENTITDQWLKTYLEPVKDIVNAVSVSWKHRIKIAVLDTGLNAAHPEVAKLITAKDKKSPGIKGWKSWVSSDDDDALVDTDGHGTHCAMTLAQVADQADIYICRVFTDGKHSESGDLAQINEADHVAAVWLPIPSPPVPQLTPDPFGMHCPQLTFLCFAKPARAIRHAVDTWAVDIITMSFGFSRIQDAQRLTIREALFYASSKNVLLFAAASNAGKNAGRTFPARDPHVICIHSTNGKGNPSGFNPPFYAEDRNFCILGERVSQPYRGQTGSTRMSGTSVATPIAAGVAAMILHFARQPRLPKLSELPADRLRKLWSRDGIRQVFLEMKEDERSTAAAKDYFYLVPWNFLGGKFYEDVEDSRDRIARRVYQILQELD